MLLKLYNNISLFGGEGGIRTPGTRKRTIDFESTALDHSATSPKSDGKVQKRFAAIWKNIAKTKNAGAVMQIMHSLQTPDHEL